MTPWPLDHGGSTGPAVGGAIDRCDPSSPLYSPLSPTGVSLCRGCADAARCRLGIQRAHLTDDGRLVSELSCPASQQGGPGVAHGAWIAGILDDLTGQCLLAREEYAVTGTLTVRFRRPVPLEQPLIGRGSLDWRENRRIYISTSLEMAESGEILARANAIMINRTAAHFAPYEQWLATQRSQRHR